MYFKRYIVPLEIRTYLYFFGLSSRKKKFKYILIINCCGQIQNGTDIINYIVKNYTDDIHKINLSVANFLKNK